MRRTLLFFIFSLIVMYPLSVYAQSGNEVSTSGENQQEKQAGQVKDQRQETPTVGEQHREEKKSIQATPVEQGGALLPFGRFVVEPFFEYDHSSSQNVSLSGYTIFEAILIGQVSVQKIRRDIFIPGATFRLGMKDFEFNVKVPYFFRKDSLIFPQSGAGTSQLVEKNLSDHDLGDIESYIYYYLIKEGPIAPDTIIRVGVNFPTGKDPYHCKREYISELGAVLPVEFPTGTGHWGSSVGVTFAKSADPAVVFMNLAYYYNFKRNVGIVNDINYGEIKLGNSFE
ncbi:MAG: hypothetical protein ABSB79_16045, partial [Syntrophales bacterium]